MDQQPVIPINIILASNSPRRKQLLQDAGVQFRVFTPTEPVDETLDADLLAQPEEAVKKLAERKAGAAVQEVLAQNPVGLGFVIGADTMVVLDGEIFGKPYSADHAREMLRKLSGKTHQVITGVSVWMMLLNETEENGGDGNVSIGFRTFTETSEGAVLVEGYEGDYNNIVGLPVDKLLENFPDLLRREVPVEITQKEA